MRTELQPLINFLTYLLMYSLSLWRTLGYVTYIVLCITYTKSFCDLICFVYRKINERRRRGVHVSSQEIIFCLCACLRWWMHKSVYTVCISCLLYRGETRWMKTANIIVPVWNYSDISYNSATTELLSTLINWTSTNHFHPRSALLRLFPTTELSKQSKIMPE